jgi:hypothetical protein
MSLGVLERQLVIVVIRKERRAVVEAVAKDHRRKMRIVMIGKKIGMRMIVLIVSNGYFVRVLYLVCWD